MGREPSLSSSMKRYLKPSSVSPYPNCDAGAGRAVENQRRYNMNLPVWDHTVIEFPGRTLALGVTVHRRAGRQRVELEMPIGDRLGSSV